MTRLVPVRPERLVEGRTGTGAGLLAVCATRKAADLGPVPANERELLASYPVLDPELRSLRLVTGVEVPSKDELYRPPGRGVAAEAAVLVCK